MVACGRRRILEASIGSSVIGLTGLTGCLGMGDSSSLTMNYVAPIDNRASFFELPEIQDELDNLGEEYELEVVRDSASTDSINAMAAGESDIVMFTTDPFAHASIQEVIPGGFTGLAMDFWDAHPDYYGFEVYSPPDSDITEPEDLEGQRLGIPALGTSVHGVFIRMLSDIGLDPDEDVEYIEQGFPALIPAMEDDIIDVGIFAPQFAASARLNDYNLVFSTHDLYDEAIPAAFMTVRNDFLDENEDVIRAWVEDWAALFEYLDENRDEIVPPAAEHFEIDEDVVDHFFLTEHDYYRGELEFDNDRYQFVIDEMYELEIIDERFNVSNYLSNEYIRI